ncbi:MAG: transposase, partial [Bacteroidetes bacterium]|nr:transposase [Bacteroidota bacterium]MBI3510552.1 transposase [Bacteroidota bacterium]
AEEYQHDYNYNRPHKSLNYKTPVDLIFENKE